MEENISEKIKYIIDNIPSDNKDLSDDENDIRKLRWIYINLGKIISYDYKNLDYDHKVNIDDKYISKYQTCVQVSDILNQVINKVDDLKSISFERKLNNTRHFEQEHLANSITFRSGEKMIVDLIIDLPRIQNSCRTTEFGGVYISDLGTFVIGPYDPICNDIDSEFNLYENGYNNKKIDELKQKLDNTNFSEYSFLEEVDYSINSLLKFLNKDCDFVEATNFLDDVLFERSSNGFSGINGTIDRHNLTNSKTNEKVRIYTISRNNEEAWYIYSVRYGLIKTNMDDVKALIDNGWYNKSGELYNYFDNVNRSY